MARSLIIVSLLFLVGCDHSHPPEKPQVDPLAQVRKELKELSDECRKLGGIPILELIYRDQLWNMRDCKFPPPKTSTFKID